MVPQVKPTDPEDVSWALSTAQTSFGRGDVHEALKWLRRAAEAASEAEQDDRALELAKAVAELADKAGASRPPPAPPVSRPPASAAPPRPPTSAPRPASVAPRPPAVPQIKPASVRPPSTGPTPPRAPAAAAKPKRKSIPDDHTDKVALPPAHEEPPVTPRAAPVEEKKARRKSRDDLTRPSNMDELEAMQTQTMQAHELPEFEERGSTKVGTPALRVALAAERGAVPIMAAARVHLVKGDDGVVRVSIAATEKSVPVMIVPIEPGTDLSKLLG